MTNSKMKISNAKRYLTKLVTSLTAMAVFASFAAVGASAAENAEEYSGVSSETVLYAGAQSKAATPAVKLAKVKMRTEAKYGNDSTHPYNKQSSAITLNWNPVDNAVRYQIYIKGGKYKSWKKIKTVFATQTSYTVTKLARNTEYSFKVRATVPGTAGPFSSVQKIKTARIDFNKAGWQAMCRIVYHEVGQINDSMWNKPIVYVSDCVVNRFEAAKYLNDPLWAPYYRNYSTVQDMIYKSGGFMSDAGLARDGATYTKCTKTVKLAVYGAVYDKVMVDNISNDDDVYYWSNTSYRPNSYKVAYSYRIPWGYFNIWSEYWG